MYASLRLLAKVMDWEQMCNPKAQEHCEQPMEIKEVDMDQIETHWEETL